MRKASTYARRIGLALVLAAGLPATYGCDGSVRDEQTDGEETSGAGAIVVHSGAFDEGEPIPSRHARHGQNVSPPLDWTGVPDGAAELAMICDDPDAPSDRPWVYWVIYAIPPGTTRLPAGVEPVRRLDEPAGALQGVNSWDEIGYGGPAPPPGDAPHHYHFKLYALDAELDLEPGLSKAGLLEAMQGHVLAEGALVGTFRRRE